MVIIISISFHNDVNLTEIAARLDWNKLLFSHALISKNCYYHH